MSKLPLRGTATSRSPLTIKNGASSLNFKLSMPGTTAGHINTVGPHHTFLCKSCNNVGPPFCFVCVFFLQSRLSCVFCEVLLPLCVRVFHFLFATHNENHCY